MNRAITHTAFAQ